MKSVSRKRGRPPGTGRNDDLPLLANVADAILQQHDLRPTTAIKRILGRPRNGNPSEVRRLREKWNSLGGAMLAAARLRLDQPERPQLAARRDFHDMLAQIAQAQKMFEEMTVPARQVLDMIATMTVPARQAAEAIRDVGSPLSTMIDHAMKNMGADFGRVFPREFIEPQNPFKDAIKHFGLDHRLASAIVGLNDDIQEHQRRVAEVLGFLGQPWNWH